MTKNINIALPSYVLPKSTKENIEFLRDKTREIALLCFEPSLPCLSDLESFRGKWHIHLPSYVPEDFYGNYASYEKLADKFNEHTVWKDCWRQAENTRDIEIFALSCVQIFRHCESLNPKFGVLHLPHRELPHAQTFLDCFLSVWQKHFPVSLLCLENVRAAAYEDFEDIINKYSCPLCFDIAHALTYGQTACLERNDFMRKVKAVHWSAPYEENTEQKGKDKHLGLYHLKRHKDYCINVLKNVPQNATHVLELFSWEEIEKSLAFFQQIFLDASED